MFVFADFTLVAAQIIAELFPYKLYYGETLKVFAGLSSTPHSLNYFEYTTVAQSEPNPILLVVDFLLVVIQTAVEHRPYEFYYGAISNCCHKLSSTQTLANEHDID